MSTKWNGLTLLAAVLLLGAPLALAEEASGEAQACDKAKTEACGKVAVCSKTEVEACDKVKACGKAEKAACGKQAKPAAACGATRACGR